MTAYLTTNRLIDDARAQGASEARDAGLDVPDAQVAGPATVEPVVTAAPTEPDPTKVVDPVAKPSEAFIEAKEFWNAGGFQFAVYLLLLIASIIYVRLKPGDKDGDGKPDIEGWRGKTWAIAGASLMVLVPLLAKAAGELGATWNAVGIGLVGGVGLLMTNINPQRGAKHPDAPG